MSKVNITKDYLAFLPIFFLFGILGYAQEELKDKINKIDGDVDRVTITAGGEEYTFEGDEAKELYKKMKSSFSKSHSFMWHSNDDDFDNYDGKIIFIEENEKKKLIEISEDGDEDIEIYISKDIDMDDQHGIEKKINVEIEDGNKKVTITTKENGEEKTEVYEGEEADEYLEKMKSEHGNEMMIEIDKNGKHKKMKKIIIKKEIDDDDDD